jgi:hypothetical protein
MPEIPNNRQYHRDWIGKSNSISGKTSEQSLGFQYAIQPDGTSLGERLWKERRQRTPNVFSFRHHDLNQSEPPLVPWKEIELWSSSTIQKDEISPLLSNSCVPSTSSYDNPHTATISQNPQNIRDSHAKLNSDEKISSITMRKTCRKDVLEDCDDLFLDLDVDKLVAERRNHNGLRSSGISEVSLLSSDMITPKGSLLSNSFLSDNTSRNDCVIVSGKSSIDKFQHSVVQRPSSFYDLCDTSNDDSSIQTRYHSKSPFQAPTLTNLNYSSTSKNSLFASRAVNNDTQSSLQNQNQDQNTLQSDRITMSSMNATGIDFQNNTNPSSSNGYQNLLEAQYDSVHHSSNSSYSNMDNNFISTDSSSLGNQEHQVPLCPMHNIPCRLLTARSEANAGRQFYKCALSDQNACDFFQWADGQDTSWNHKSTNTTPLKDIVSPAGEILDYGTENRRKFGHSSFRLGQKEVIENALQGRDVFVLMPTGGGKSLCYQLPAWCCPGLSVVISPLLSLIQDQVQSMTKLGVQSVFLNSAQDYETEQRDIQRRLFSTTAHGGIKLLYITPEKLRHSGVIRNVLKTLYDRNYISRFVVDEAHCLR